MQQPTQVNQSQHATSSRGNIYNRGRTAAPPLSVPAPQRSNGGVVKFSK